MEWNSFAMWRRRHSCTFVEVREAKREVSFACDLSSARAGGQLASAPHSEGLQSIVPTNLCNTSKQPSPFDKLSLENKIEWHLPFICLSTQVDQLLTKSCRGLRVRTTLLVKQIHQ